MQYRYFSEGQFKVDPTTGTKCRTGQLNHQFVEQKFVGGVWVGIGDNDGVRYGDVAGAGCRFREGMRDGDYRVDVETEVAGFLLAEGDGWVNCGSVSGVLSRLPEGLTLSLIPGGVKIDWTDNTLGVARTEIWGKNNSEDYVLLYTVLAGQITRNDICEPVDLRYYKIRQFVGESYSEFTEEVSIAMLGAELFPSVATWAAIGLAWWDLHNATWSGDGTKVMSSGINGHLRKNGFWSIGKTYRILHIATGSVTGPVYGPYDGTANFGLITTTVGQTIKTQYKPTATDMYISASAGWNGNVSQLSVKEVLVPLTNIKSFGFSPSASAAVNTAALQSAVTGGNSLYIPAGIYELNDTVLLDSNTTIFCEDGVEFKKISFYWNVFLNRGALTKEYNENITIVGLKINHIVGNGDYDTTPVRGMIGQLSFYYIKNLTINDFTLLDVANGLYGIYLCKWEDISLNNISDTTGGGDCISLQTGHDAFINNVILQSKDDGLGIKCIEVPVACTEVGDVYNVTYKNIIDRTPVGQTIGARTMMMMTASWADFLSGNMYQSGGLTLNDGKLYQCENEFGFSGVGTIYPVHTTGVVTGADGIIWRYKQNSSIYHADIYNIKFDGLICTKDRPSFYFSLYNNQYCMAAYPGTESLSTIRDIVVRNSSITFTAQQLLFVSSGNLRNILFLNCVFDNLYFFYHAEYSRLDFINSLEITLRNNEFKNLSNIFILDAAPSEAIRLITSGNTYSNSVFVNNITAPATLEIIGNDLPFN